MRENRTHGSEGGESGLTGLPYPYPCPCWLFLGRQEFQQRLVRSNDQTVYR